MRKKVKRTHCMDLAFAISTIQGYFPVLSNYEADGVYMIVRDSRDDQEYEIKIKPYEEKEQDDCA